MASVTVRIQEAAPRNRELLLILSETDHAPPDLEQQKKYIADLNRQLQQTQKQIQVLDRKREKEFKEHEKYRDSVMRRWAYKAARKSDQFEEKAAKEEREYFEALQESHRATDMEKNLKNLQQEALGTQSSLEQQVARHVEAQRDIDGLYDSIFQGPTPEFPEEDDRERQTSLALSAYHDARVRSEAEAQALDGLKEASKRLHNAIICIEEALDHSRMDMFGGGSVSDMMERNALHKAEMQVTDAYWLVTQAKRSSPAVHDLPPVKIAQGNIMSDMFFDNIFTDMAFHDKIKDSRQEVETCTKVLNAQLQASQGRYQELDWDTKNKSQALEAARAELQKARSEIFERSAGADSAPAYSA
ncbi:hypothetical protein BJ170DRAFT_596870 [Xylariales sp. AK1849]|nr:hypothetical protein BJ170DRAFT_596870 [Xylariales sp. AK1849]